MFTNLFGRRRNGSHLPHAWNGDADIAREVSIVLTGAGVPTLRQALPRLSAELDRARRYSRPLAIQLFADDRVLTDAALDPSVAAASGARSVRDDPSPLAPGSALVPAIVASVLREIVRETDIVAYAAALGRCVVLMPEVTGEEARRAMERIGELCASRLTFPIRAGIAAFPEDGWTLDELIRHAADQRRPDASLSREGAGIRRLASL